MAINQHTGLHRAASNAVVKLDHCAVAHPLLDELLAEGSFGDATEVTLRVGAATGERLAMVGDGPALDVLTSTGALFQLDPRERGPIVLRLPRGVRPAAIATPSAMDLVMADAGSGVLLELTDGGTTILARGLEDVVDLAASDRRLVLVDRGGRRIHTFDGDRRQVLERKELARAVAITSRGQLALLGERDVTLLDADGTAAARISTAALSVERPIAIAASNGQLYLLDGAARRVVVVREGRSLAARVLDLMRGGR